MEILPNVQIKYPEYSVITPQTMREYTVRTLNVEEEEHFKSSILIPNQFAEHLNKIIWACIVKKSGDITDFPTFLQKTTIRDRDALLYGLYHISYKEISDYDVYCSACEKQFPVKINIAKCFSAEPYIPYDQVQRYLDFQKKQKGIPVANAQVPEVDKNDPSLSEEKAASLLSKEDPTLIAPITDKPIIKTELKPIVETRGPEPIEDPILTTINHDEIIEKRVKVVLPTATNIIAYIKQPTLADEELVTKDPLFQSEKEQNIATELLVIDRFEIIPTGEGEDSRNKAIIKEKDNLYVLYRKLPATDRKLINKAYIDNFGKYGIALKVQTRCSFCGEVAESSIDLVNQFFRALYQ